jgi:uncharacterized protein YndB with AHSA1/START domain
MDSSIEKKIEIAAPVARVWKALTDYREFGEWFKVKLEGPFVVGQTASGQLTYSGYEHLRMEMVVTAIEPPAYFAYTWHPYAMDPKVDYSKETPTLVEFRLAETAEGTALTVTESGFDKLPAHRIADALRMNARGWEQQLQAIQAYAVAAR